MYLKFKTFAGYTSKCWSWSLSATGPIHPLRWRTCRPIMRTSTFLHLEGVEEHTRTKSSQHLPNANMYTDTTITDTNTNTNTNTNNINIKWSKPESKSDSESIIGLSSQPQLQSQSSTHLPTHIPLFDKPSNISLTEPPMVELQHHMPEFQSGLITGDTEEQKSVRVINRLKRKYDCIKDTTTEEELYNAIESRVDMGITMGNIIQTHCKLQPALPGVEQEMRARMNGHSEQLKAIHEHIKSQSNIQNNANARNTEAIAAATSGLHGVVSKWNGVMGNSSMKGSISESQVINELRQSFPEMSVEDTSGRGSSGDIRMVPTDMDTTKAEVLVEVKCYTNMLGTSQSSARSVPTQEVEKFERDVDRCKCPLALFVAIGTSISKKSRIQFEQRGETKIMFMSHANPFTVVMGALVLQELHKMNQQWKKTHSAMVDHSIAKQVLEQNMQKLAETLQRELEHNTFFSDVLKDIQELDKTTRRMRSRVEEYRSVLLHTAQESMKLLSNDAKFASMLAIGPDGNVIADTNDKRCAMFKEMQITNGQNMAIDRKNNIATRELLDALDTHNIHMRKSKGGLLLFHEDGNACGLVEVKKTKTVLRDLNNSFTINVTNEACPQLTTLLNCLFER